MTLRTMFDSTNADAIPTDAALVAGYVSPSRYAWPDWSRFTRSLLVRITPQISTVGDGVQVLDCERGDASPTQVPAWVLRSRYAGQEPTVYTNVANWAGVIRACTSVAVRVPQWWVADWNGQQDLPSIDVDGVTYTAVAHQYADSVMNNADYDLSVVAPYWPGVDSAISSGDDMFQITAPAGTDEHVELFVDGCSNIYVGTGYDDQVTVTSLMWFGPTPDAPAPAFGPIGDEITNWTIDANRPGPVPVPVGAVVAVIRYTANHAWSVGAK